MFVRKEGNSQTGDRMFAMVWPFLESPEDSGSIVSDHWLETAAGRY